MDKETLTSHIKNLSKAYFDSACSIILRDHFSLDVINVDGPYDGGTDFLCVKRNGSRAAVAYQVTTQKEKLREKIDDDVIKVANDLGVNRLFVFSSNNLGEISLRNLEEKYTQQTGLHVICYGARQVAGFLLEGGLLNKFLDRTGYPLPRSHVSGTDRRSMALYSYSVISSDARSMRDNVYDDTIAFILAEVRESSEEKLISSVIHILGLDDGKGAYLSRRVGALFSRQIVKRSGNGLLQLSPGALADVESRKRIYQKELDDLSASQIDIMRDDFSVNWTMDNSKEVCAYIAEMQIAKQVELLASIQAEAPLLPFLKQGASEKEKLFSYIKDNTPLRGRLVGNAATKLVDNASHNPLIKKLARASIYVALEGANPVAVAKAFGASNWSELDILVEPSVAIPYICSQLYKGCVNRNFDSAKDSVARAIKLDSRVHIPYFYIKECASHLIRARKYSAFDADKLADELRYSPNAFVANYYALKGAGERVPETLFDYLKTLSSSVANENNDWKQWVRSVMTDIQSILTRSGVRFVETPYYSPGDCEVFEREYAYTLQESKKNKPALLAKHDVWALQFVHDRMTESGEHWVILTWDRTLSQLAGRVDHLGWVSSPDYFLDLTGNCEELSDTRYVSLLHSVAASSEKTLSIGARIIDRVAQLASDHLQNWEFVQNFNNFRREFLSAMDSGSPAEVVDIDAHVDNFLRRHGIEVSDDFDAFEGSEVDTIEE